MPKLDANNLQPRFGFNWNPRFEGGALGWITGGDKLTVRGGYSRTNDYGFININLNIASAFPFLFALNPSLTNAYANLLSAPTPNPGDIPFITRTTVAPDFRAPAADQYSLEIQRELAKDWVMRVGYIATKGAGLFQTVDGNPVVAGRTSRTDPNFLYSPSSPNIVNVPIRVDPMRGVIRERSNSASSIYHSMQVSLDKRLSRNFSMGMHYTWSAFIDDASEIFNPQPAVLNGSDPAGVLQGIDSLVGNAIRPMMISTVDLSGMNIIDLWNAVQAARASGQPAGAPFFRQLAAGERTGNVGHNTLRADGIANLDFGLQKNTRIVEGHNLQFRAEFYNLTNTRNFGTPNSQINSGANFLNQWATNGGARRIVMGLRYTF